VIQLHLVWVNSPFKRYRFSALIWDGLDLKSLTAGLLHLVQEDAAGTLLLWMHEQGNQGSMVRQPGNKVGKSGASS
jgi:hypothetical protein